MNLNYFNNLIEQKLLSLHTCYLASVLSLNGNKATIQPLSMVKSTTGAAKNQAIIENVPICTHTLEYVLVGSVVVVICCERDISQTRKGRNTLPSVGRHHSLSDSIIIGTI